MTSQTAIRDLLYFDAAKASGILSQIESGWTTIPNTPGEFQQMITRLDQALAEQGVLLDVNQSFAPADIWEGTAHEHIVKAGYLRVTGWATLDDFRRIQFVLGKYDSFIQFLVEIHLASLKNNPETAGLLATIDNLRQTIESIQDPADRNAKRRQLEGFEAQINQYLEQSVAHIQNALPDYLKTGIGLIIETFLKDIVKLAIHPFKDVLEFHAVSHLKRSCFVGDNLDQITSAYGSRPNVQLTMLGVITGIPLPEDPRPNFSEKYRSEAMDQGFENVFAALENLETIFVRTAKYPAVTLYPIAVYRNITAAGS